MGRGLDVDRRRCRRRCAALRSERRARLDGNGPFDAGLLALRSLGVEDGLLLETLGLESLWELFRRAAEDDRVLGRSRLDLEVDAADRPREHPAAGIFFEGGAGETVRRRLLAEYDVHTLLRLPTGIFYAGGVKANVLFFDRKQARPGKPWTDKLWVYDLRTGSHFTLKQRPMLQEHLLPFVEAFNADNRLARIESERFRPFGYDELVTRDKVNLDITWLKDPSSADLDDGVPPEIIAQEIVDDLTAALAEFSAVADALSARAAATGAVQLDV